MDACSYLITFIAPIPALALALGSSRARAAFARRQRDGRRHRQRP
jgi:hypothetical protein